MNIYEKCKDPSINSISNVFESNSATLLQKPSQRLKKFLFKHHKENANKAIVNYNSVVQMFAKHIEPLDEILNSYIPVVIFELQKFIYHELNVEVENKMVSTMLSHLDHFLPIPSSDKEIQKLENLYFYSQTRSEDSFEASKYYESAIYLPTGVFPENVIMTKLYEKVDPVLTTLSSKLWSLHLGIDLRSPPVDDVHTTGELVQQTVNSWIEFVTNIVDNFRLSDGLFSDSYNRLNFLEYIYSYRQVQDVRLAYVHFERANFRILRETLRTISLELLMMQHHILLNIDLVKTPQPNIEGSLAARISN